MGRRPVGWKLRKRGNSPYWRVWFTVNGQRTERSTGQTSKTAAARVAAQIYASAAVQRPIRRLAGELGEALALWLADRKDTPYKVTLTDLAAFWCGLWPDLGSINEQSIARYISERLHEVEAPTVRKELSGLRQFLRWAKRNGYVAGIPEWDAPEGDTDYQARCLSPDEVAAVLAQLPARGRRGEPLRPYYTFMWETAFRQGTMARLRWDDVDLGTATINLPAAADKRRYARPVPLSELAAVILRQRAPAVGLVWGDRRYTESLKRAARAAGLDDKGIHDRCLRHSAITHAASYTRDLLALMHFAGHQHMATTSKYLHPSVERTREMIANRPRIVALEGALRGTADVKNRA